jgi:orotidine-5'-phosphate decarboxylase
MDFISKLTAAVAKNNSLLCIGLDPDLTKLPAPLRDIDAPYFAFNKAIIDATADLVCAYKPNSAFYEARGTDGIEELKLTIDYLHSNYPAIPVILDAKRGDIGNTNDHYAAFAFDYLGADALTVQPYQGQAAIQSFLDHADKGVIVLCRTSNDGAGEFQDLEVNGQPLYVKVAQKVAQQWNTNGNCLLVVGATAPDELARIRQTVGKDMYFLVPGIGAQGGDIAATLKAGGDHLIINSARAIIYADDPRAAAQETRDTINKYRS